MSECSANNVSGTWFGNYYYSDLSRSCGFEAAFVQQGVSLEGSILDDSGLGEANVAGTFTGGKIDFSKVYHNREYQPVSYMGVISDDGKSLSGAWRIGTLLHGTWKAWRMDGEELPELKETDQSSIEEEERTPVAPQTLR